MALTQDQKDRIFRRIIRKWSDARKPCGFEKSDLVAAIDAADAWLDANTVSYNQALPQPFRGLADIEHKGLLLVYVAMVMAGLGLEDL